MKRAVFLLLLLSLVSCNTTRRQIEFKNRLTSLDTTMSAKPKAVLDSLNKFEKNRLSSENEAYYNLLITIAEDKNYVDFTSDSVISSAVNYYDGGKDYYNYARSLMYKGIVRYTMDMKDTLSFDLLKDAEQVFINHNLKDNHLLGMIYSYLGKINKADRNFKEAEIYFQKGADVNKLSGNNFNYIVSIIDIIWSKINLRDYSGIPSYISILDKCEPIPNVLRKNVYNVKSVYFASIGDFKKAIEYTIKNMKVSNDLESKDNQYYGLSAYFLKLNLIDSAVYYAEKSIQISSDTIASSNYQLYKHLADTYKLKGDYKKAADTYYKAYEFHQKYLTEVSSKRILELEKRYDITLKDAELIKEKEAKRFFLLLLSLSVIIVGVLFILLRLRMKLLKKEKLIAEVNREKLQKTELIKETLNATTGLLTQFTDEVYLISVRAAKNSTIEIDEINNAITNIKKSFRKRLSAITNSEAFIESFPVLKHLEEFTDQERLIIVLLQQGNNANFIAQILNSTPSSIRGNKSYIKKKVAASEIISPENKESLLKILE